MNKTILIDTLEVGEEKLKMELKSICDSLKKRGYNPIKQIAGYIISGDPGYISSYDDCRNRIQSIDRTSLVELLLSDFLK